MITVKDNKLIIEDLVVDDPDVVAMLSTVQGDDEWAVAEIKQDLVVRALRIGFMALQRAQTQVDLNAVRYQFDLFQQQVVYTLDDIFKEDNGKLVIALQQYLGEGGKLADLFDPQRKDSAISRIQAIFDDHFTGDGAKFAKMLDYTEENSPLRKLHSVFDQRFKDIEKQILEVQKQLAKEAGREEEYERGTIKGVDFEEYVKEVLDQSARIHRDSVTLIGTETEGGRSKKGDVLIEVFPDDIGGRTGIFILVETKRQKSKAVTGKTGILQEIEDAMSTRNARYGMAVFSDDACPREVGKLRAYPGNRLICSIDLDGNDAFVLEAAYQIARTELCWQLRQDFGEIDRAQVTDGLNRINEKLRQFQGLKQKATELGKISTSIRDQLDEIELSILSELKSIAQQI
jgi:hypothetical protein